MLQIQLNHLFIIPNFKLLHNLERLVLDHTNHMMHGHSLNFSLTTYLTGELQTPEIFKSFHQMKSHFSIVMGISSFYLWLFLICKQCHICTFSRNNFLSQIRTALMIWGSDFFL